MKPIQRVKGITVVIPTYKRPKIVAQSIRYLKLNLITREQVQYLVGCDGGMDDAIEIGHMKNVTPIAGPGRGLGANLNMLLRRVETDIVFQMDDDHMLVGEANVDDYVMAIRHDPMVGWVRLMMGERKDSQNIDTFYKFLARLRGRYWILIPDKELYLPSNRPHLKRADFHEFYGYYKEDARLGQVETEFCHRYADMWGYDGLPRVAIPLYPPPEGTWTHVGDSWQKKGF